jgi:hypothetical protein
MRGGVSALRLIKPLNRCLPGAKWPQPEASHSPACSADVKKEWSFISICIYVFTAWSIKHADEFNFTQVTGLHYELA